VIGGPFAELYDRVAPRVFSVVRSVLRDPAQSEEVTQEVLVELWRTAPRFDATRGEVTSWATIMARQRAIDRVRHEQASRDRDQRAAIRDRVRPFDEVAEQAATSMEHEHVRAALDGLTDLQREAIHLAYYGGHTLPEVSRLLGLPLGTVKTRVRDGLIRLRATMDAE
jgi:RNA polymerase sigma-70 factor (ECF subfamily)